MAINSSMQYATTQRQGPRAYIIGTDSCIRVVAYTFCIQLLLYQRIFVVQLIDNSVSYAIA